MSDDVLREFRDAVARRSKSLKHAFRTVALEGIADQADGQFGLQLSATAWREGRPPILRLQLWPDRWVWFDARQAGPGGGWKWSWTIDGRLSHDRSARDMLDAFQGSLAHLPDSLEHAAEIWAEVLLTDAGGRRKVQLAKPN
jgi:hypothetical protein